MPFKIGFYCLREFEKETNFNALTLERPLTMGEIESLFFHSYINGCNAGKAEGWSVKYSREELVEMLDYMFTDFCNLIPDLITDYVDANKKKSNPVTSKKAKKT